MKKIIRTICMSCIALSIPLSTVYSQDIGNSQSKGNSDKTDNIPEYIEIDDNEVFFNPVENDEYDQIPVSGATLAWRDIRPETDPNVTPSRSVTIGLNQYLEVEYPGNEWIYLGEAEETNHVRYYGRKLGRDNTVFTLCSKEEAGTVLLHFYCIDPLNGTSISDYLEVVVEDRTTGTSKKAVAPSYASAFPANQHSNEFDYVTPTVKDVHKEPDTPYTLEVPNPPKENTVAVPKTSSAGKSSTTGKSTSSTTQTTTTSKSATSSSSTSSTKNTSSSASSTAPAASSSGTTKSTSSSTTSAATKPAASSTAKNSSSSTSTAKSTNSTTQTTATKPAASSSGTSSTKNTSSAATSTAPATSSTAKSSSTGTTRSTTSSASSTSSPATPSTGTTRSASSSATSSTATTSSNPPASASIATGNPTTRSISRSASSPVAEDYDTSDYGYEDTDSYSNDNDAYSYGYSSMSGSNITSGPSIAANTGSDYSSLSGTELLEKAKEAYNNAKYAECLSYLDEFFISSASDTDEALYLKGQALEAPGSSRNIKGALDAYETLVKNYPYSKYWEPANERVIYIKRFYINIR